jgi:fermentation-respiration switch protein FrsA (DUF1100 family)
MDILIIVCVALAVIFGIAVGFLVWGFNYACRGKRKGDVSETGRLDVKGFGAEINSGAEWVRNASGRFVSIESYDGLKLSARYLEREDSDVCVVMMHGYRSAPEIDFSMAAKSYYINGYSVLLPYQRAHGISEGKYITYGVRESRDCKDWVEYAVNTLGKKRIILSGMSMGTATVLLAAGLGLPENVVGITADCGFTCPAEIIGRVMEGMHVPSRIVLPILNLLFKHVAGFDAYAHNTVDAMKENKIPVLFIHGENDGFVPCEMTLRNYEACAAPKTLITVPGADHGVSYLVDKEYVGLALRKFFAEVLCEEKQWI